MKAQFKYAFREGLSVRGITFCIVFGMMLVFIVLGSLKLLPFAALITAVSLGGVGIAAMMVANIISDVNIARRIFVAPGAYLYALAPAHRGKTLFSSVVAMIAMDLVTGAFVIIGEVWLSLLLAWGTVPQDVVNAMGASIGAREQLLSIILGMLVLLAGYLFVAMSVIFGVTLKRSVFYQKPAGGLLAFLSVCACWYVFSLMQLALAPFGVVHRYGVFFSIVIGVSQVVPAIAVYALLLLLSAAGLFVLTSRLMERKLNI